MQKVSYLFFSAAVLAFAPLVGVDARSAELRRTPIPATLSRTGRPTATPS
jgi:hypothetical protein